MQCTVSDMEEAGLPTLAQVKAFLSRHGSAAMPQPTTVTTTLNQSSGLFSEHRFTGSRYVDFSSSFTVSGRVGYWFEQVPGLASRLTSRALKLAHLPCRSM